MIPIFLQTITFLLISNLKSSPRILKFSYKTHFRSRKRMIMVTFPVFRASKKHQISNFKIITMIQRILFFCVLFAFGTTANAQFGDMINKAKESAKVLKNGGSVKDLSEGQIGNGLKEALDVGVKKAVNVLSAENGYLDSPYKILIPEDAQKVTSKLKNVPGFQDVETKLVNKMNEAAEIAAKKATPIFVNAIKSMTINDAMDILMGNKDSATRYLEKSTSNSLQAEFLPVIQNALDEVNAREYWRTATTAYNKLPFVQKTNPELDQYVTEMALNGMFKEVEVKERDIRANQSSRSTDLLKDVFAKQDGN